MKDSNRREILSKLGLGAAALAGVAATAGSAQAGPKVARRVARAAAPAHRVVRVNRTGRGAGTQIKVRYGRGGIRVTEVKSVARFTKAGWDQARKELNLAVAVNGESIAIEGLGNIVAAADGRCNISMSNRAEQVSNPAPMMDIRGRLRR